MRSEKRANLPKLTLWQKIVFLLTHWINFSHSTKEILSFCSCLIDFLYLCKI